MVKRENPRYEQVMRVHSIIFGATVGVPLILWLTGALPVNRCFAMVGVGLFILSGHSIAFFDDYLMHLRRKETGNLFDERGLRRFLRMGIIIDLSLAFFFYMMGVG